MKDIVDTITRAYERDAASPPSALTATDIPWSSESMTPAWFTAVLCRNTPGAKVEHIVLGERDDGSTNRRHIELRYNEAGRAARLPERLFCKVADQLLNRIMLGAAGTAQAEVFFFNNLRAKLPIEAPRALFAGFDEESFAYAVVFEDLSDKVAFCDESTVIDRARAESMVTLLADFHAAFHQDPALGTPAVPYRPWPEFWGNLMLHSPGWDDSSRRSIDRMGERVPPPLLARRDEIWPCTEASVRAHAALPQTLMHSDVHLKNWYAMPDGTMGLSDWQIMSIGNWSRDFVYAVTTALAVEDRRAWEDDLLRLYLERSAQNGVGAPSFDEARLLCRQQVFSALAFWTVTLCPAQNMPSMQPEKTSLVFIERLLTSIDDHDALDSFS
ncbi:phosphotransferase [Novosphingobium sp. 9U]|uniref:phosphotransferase n=1 Tax=Novosphingobium sp. 9U TaxID=2653158 RepID=UPI0012F34AD9|nr:phosphotransferase [Novosphingobium sp. 9U]VWX50118.1 conserved hypothetical protein [Novosphingobium sp. 9U]